MHALIFSISAHGFLFLLWMDTKSYTPPFPPEPISIEITDGKDGPLDSHSAESTPVSKPLLLSPFAGAFAWKSKKNSKNGNNEEEESDGPGSRGHGWSDEDFGVGGMDIKNVEDYITIEKLAQEVEGLLFYPPALALREISGGVNARLHMLETGGCDHHRMRIESPSPYFRVYILALLKKLCALPQAKDWKLSKSKRADLNFLFLLKDQADFKSSPPFKISGNVAMFERHEFKSPIEIRAGPLRFYGLYVAVDFPYIFEKWDQLTTGRDPMEPFR